MDIKIIAVVAALALVLFFGRAIVVKAFNGIIGYYRRKIKEDSSKTLPLPLAVRYILKNAAFMAHHTKLHPGNSTFNIPIVDYTIPNSAMVEIHTFIGFILLILVVKIHVICAYELGKDAMRYLDSAVDWIRKNRKG